jgi:stringent starvation protein B
MNALDATSTRPYLIRALYEWCTDNGFTPYIAVLADESVQVPREYVKDGEIVLNVSFDATSSLKLGNDFIEFKARFAGTAREILVPISRVLAIYARENGQGMAFPSPVPVASGGASSASVAAVPAAPAGTDEAKTAPAKVLQLAPVDSEDRGDDPEPPKPSGNSPRPALKRVK